MYWEMPQWRLEVWKGSNEAQFHVQFVVAVIKEAGHVSFLVMDYST
jgi:hypothetical protein